MINFRSYQDMHTSITRILDKIRKLDVDIVIGIPRSGIVPAATIALSLQKPYGDLTSLLSGFVADTSGKRIPISNKTILLVDDTVNTGSAITDAIKQIRSAGINNKILTFAVWHSDKTDLGAINLTAGFCPRPRVFAWNLWKHHKLGRFGFDMDGVLCRDPTKKENDKGEKLLHFYKTAEVKFLPKKSIGYIITSRLEKYRDVTEDWLYRNNIQYSNLIMKDSEETHATYKSNIINKIDILLYVESDAKQAKQISSKSNVPIWCIDNQTLYTK